MLKAGDFIVDYFIPFCVIVFGMMAASLIFLAKSPLSDDVCYNVFGINGVFLIKADYVRTESGMVKFVTKDGKVGSVANAYFVETRCSKDNTDKDGN